MITGFVAILFLATQSLALSPSASGDWIEICGEFGVELIKVSDSQTPEPQSDGPDCGTCVMCAVSAGAVVVVPDAALAPTHTTALILPSAKANVAGPAATWHIARGPPLLLTPIRRRAPTW